MPVYDFLRSAYELMLSAFSKKKAHSRMERAYGTWVGGVNFSRASSPSYPNEEITPTPQFITPGGFSPPPYSLTEILIPIVAPGGKPPPNSMNIDLNQDQLETSGESSGLDCST